MEKREAQVFTSLNSDKVKVDQRTLFLDGQLQRSDIRIFKTRDHAENVLSAEFTGNTLLGAGIVMIGAFVVADGLINHDPRFSRLEEVSTGLLIARIGMEVLHNGKLAWGSIDKIPS